MFRKLAFLCVTSIVFGFASELRVPVSVQAETTLRPSDFQAAVTGAGKAPVVMVRTPKDDLLVVVVLDVVGDLAFAGPAKTALAEAVRNLPERAHVTLLRAQEGMQVALDPTADREAFEAALTAIPVNGKAALLDTVEPASRLADAVATKSNVRVAILYVTDSAVRNYREDFTNPVINSSDSRDLSRRFPEGLIRERISRISEALTRYQTPLFIVHIRYASERLDEAYQNGLLQLANLTGGSAQFCRSAAEIPDAIAQTVRTLADQYRVHVQLPAKSPRSVNLSLASGDLQLNYRTRFILR